MILDDRRRFLALRERLLELVRERTQDAAAEQEAKLGSLKPFDAHYLAQGLRRSRPRRLLEIGSYLGLSTRWMLEVSAPWAGQIVSIDPDIRHWRFDRPSEIRQQLVADQQHRYTWHRAFLGGHGSLAPDLVALAAGIPILDVGWSERFDAVFIDGDHAYEAVKRDYAITRHWLNPEGIILFHDAIQHEGVARFVREEAAAAVPGQEIRIPGRLIDRAGRLLLCKGLDGVAVFRGCSAHRGQPQATAS